jgi:hypothetical protein
MGLIVRYDSPIAFLNIHEIRTKLMNQWVPSHNSHKTLLYNTNACMLFPLPRLQSNFFFEKGTRI